MAKFYTIMLNPRGNPAQYSTAIEGALSSVVQDWLRFTTYQYIVLTDRGAEQIYRAVIAQLPPESHVLVMALEAGDRHGYVSQMVLDWVKRNSP